MDYEKIASIISVVLSAIATIIATLKKAKTTRSIEDIEAKAEEKKAKYIAKQYKKNKIKVEPSEVAKTNGQNTEVAAETLGLTTEVK